MVARVLQDPMAPSREDVIKVTSPDGTSIAAFRTGRGPPLVLVHGATADHTRWPSVLPLLEPHFTCYAMDRRGRGASGDTTPYALDREHEDVAAVCDAVGEPVNLLGHSYGGLCALGAAALTDKVRRLLLYEAATPPPELAGEVYRPGVIEKLEAMLARGDRDGMVATMLREIALLTEEEVAALRAQPSWKNRLAAAPTLPRELRADKAWRLDPALAARVKVPTLLLLGGASPPVVRAGTEMLRKALPDARVVEMPGQGHVAMNTAPELFAKDVLALLR